MNKTLCVTHQMVAITVTPVNVTEVAGVPVPTFDLSKTPDTNYGCRVCNMGLAEAVTCDCPGGDLFAED